MKQQIVGERNGANQAWETCEWERDSALPSRPLRVAIVAYSVQVSTIMRILAFALILSCALPAPATFAADSETNGVEIATNHVKSDLPTTADEARGRAKVLHETIHGALQVMHRDFFGGDEDLSLPSQSLEDVFKEIASSWNIEIRWLGVNATKSVDHDPKDEFEKAAAAALVAGKTEYESIERGNFRFVGAIRMQNECLKCHVPHRSSLEDRVAGLAISIPLQKPEN